MASLETPDVATAFCSCVSQRNVTWPCNLTQGTVHALRRIAEAGPDIVGRASIFGDSCVLLPACVNLCRLCENAICRAAKLLLLRAAVACCKISCSGQPRQVVDELLHLCDSDPSNLELSRSHSCH